MRTKLHDGGGDIVIVERAQDVGDILREAKAKSNEGLHGSNELKHAMTIPNVILEAYCNNNGITFNELMNNDEHIKRILNDPALSHFRVWKGRV
ncbi:hypothetical protein HMPREF3144_06490 [Oligella sp. HMSC05A10]|uniref:hypothetical protein n=1 Tax=unclassified Oligella TaxID=2622760 RepID=UPI0008A5DF81|nr:MULTISPECIES: hypothetical protein [unclassified Oligella]OFS84489.1 hypothetical protein HMPREF3144_06490 [Oligella sp. HMSC05A10]OFV50046.1 hypothetical protein HMPREF3179_03010 [Oligella sp. HMSC09E12]